MAWQAIGHGADDVGLLAMAQRSERPGGIHGVLIGPDGTPVPLYEEIKENGSEFAKVEGSLRGTARFPRLRSEFLRQSLGH